jgi:adenine phosphoribosyltransferase
MQPQPAMEKQYEDLKKLIREVPDWPKPGILFYDLTTLLKDPRGLRRVLDELEAEYRDKAIDLVMAVEARGFIFGAPLADRLAAGFVPVRKPRKLPAEAARVTYALEYGEDTIEVHKDAIAPAQRVLIVDDLLATGGTAAACVQLARSLSADIVAAAFVVELTFLHGREKLAGECVFSLLKYDR